MTLDIQAIRERVEALRREPSGHGKWHLSVGPHARRPEGPAKRRLYSPRDGVLAYFNGTRPSIEQFLVHSLADIPALLDEVERLTNEVEVLKEMAVQVNLNLRGCQKILTIMTSSDPHENIPCDTEPEE